MAPRDYYEIMGIHKNASEKDIKTAYRRLARKYHPDISKEANAEEKFKELGQAYEVLKDPKKRAEYDKYGADWERVGQQQEAYQHYRGPQPQWQEAGFDDDFLSSIFGHARPKQRPGEDLQASLTISLEEAYKGSTRTLEIPAYKTTEDGRIIQSTQTLNVKIPAGIREGHKMRLAGQGAPSLSKGPKGNLFLTIHFHKHPLYEVKEDDIYLTLPISPWEAALGTTLKVPTLGGLVDLKIPANSQSGQKLRLKGRGLPSKTPGDQFVLLKMVNPPDLNEQSKQLYEQLASSQSFNPRAKMGM